MQKENQIRRISLLQQLQIQTALTKSVIRKIEEMFDPTYIFSHKKFKKIIGSHPKGYVPFPAIFQQEQFVSHLNAIGLSPLAKEQYSSLSIFLYYSIQYHSKKLWANPGSVRPLRIYDDKSVSSLYVQNFTQQGKCQAFQTLLHSKCNISNIRYNAHLTWAIVSTSNPSAVLDLNGYEWETSSRQGMEGEDEAEDNKLRIYSCEQYERLQQNSKHSRQDNIFNRLYQRKSYHRYPCFEEFIRPLENNNNQQESIDQEEILEKQFSNFCAARANSYNK